MLITLKNKDTLIIDDFAIKCSIGKNGIKKVKKEGDKSTPKGVFKFTKLYYRADKVFKPKVNIPSKIITKTMGWCDDPTSKLYNQEIKVNKKIKHEKLFRKDNSYNYFLVLNYNMPKSKPYKGSAIFLHLTNNYKPTEGCIAIKKKDFLILLKLLNHQTKINII